MQSLSHPTPEKPHPAPRTNLIRHPPPGETGKDRKSPVVQFSDCAQTMPPRTAPTAPRTASRPYRNRAESAKTAGANPAKTWPSAKRTRRNEKYRRAMRKRRAGNETPRPNLCGLLVKSIFLRLILPGCGGSARSGSRFPGCRKIEPRKTRSSPPFPPAHPPTPSRIIACFPSPKASPIHPSLPVHFSGAVAGGIVTQESRRVVGAVFSRDLYRFQKRPPEGQ